MPSHPRSPIRTWSPRRRARWTVTTTALIALTWWVTTDRTPGWTGIELATPVFGSVEITDGAGAVVAHQSRDNPSTRDPTESFALGPGIYSVTTCVGSPFGQHVSSVVVIPGMHTKVWNEPPQDAAAFVQFCSN